jgi:hypothetical protein
MNVANILWAFEVKKKVRDGKEIDIDSEPDFHPEVSQSISFQTFSIGIHQSW